MVILALLFSQALAGTPDVTLNGVDIAGLRDRAFSNVDVYIDADGNIHLTSERYQVEVQDGPDATGLKPPPRPATTPSTSSSTSRPRPSRLQPRPATSPSAAGSPPTDTAASADTSASTGAAIAPGSWWLATEDNASRGHEVRVYLNGTLVNTVSSGQAQVIQDVSTHLRRGTNDVMIMTRSLNAGGGGFYVYIGEGSNANGSVTLAQPEIQHGLGASRQGDDVRKYTLVVD